MGLLIDRTVKTIRPKPGYPDIADELVSGLEIPVLTTAN